MPAEVTIHRTVNGSDNFGTVLVSSHQRRYSPCVREHIEQRSPRRAGSVARRPGKQSPETIGHRLLEIVVYDKCCKIGGSLRLDDLADSEIGDWTMPNYRTACRYAAYQGWLIIGDDTLTLTIAGLRAA